ncbi:type II secretion system F family protein [Piscibacillus salipiscarius]|uniref:type II secretion system F family protein n=1 Tax=Piscibacillus salipiscarius TaxID=299480 RepID=UPI002436BC49|nr:type II secretion system F family protein [Piscibacillus salipiscarius]
MKDSLILLKTQNENDTLKYFATITLKQLSNGTSLYHSIKDFPFIQEDLKWVINRSDEQGTLSYDLQQYSLLLLESLEERIKQTIMLIQPVLYAIVGLLVVTVYMLTIFPHL